MKKLALIFFVATCLAQWYIPARMIYDAERVLSGGVKLKFKTRPVDPSDPFRGKYITLNFEASIMTFQDSGDWHAGQEVFVTFNTDSKGFARINEALHAAPESGEYLRTTVAYVYRNEDGYTAEIKLPFDRFYLEESKASEAEKAYWQSLRDEDQTTYAVVSLGKGQAVLQDVFINDQSVVDIVNDLNKDAG